MLTWLQSLPPPTNLPGPTVTAYALFDIFLIVVLARLLGTLMTRIGQPRVVGEILAGVLLGPTLLGANLSGVIAPPQARPIIAAVATLALILFMFLAGVEYDANVVKGRTGQAALFATLAIAIPALMGFPVARAMHTGAYAGPAGAEFVPFALFIGAALSVTAFPVMAHILMERGELNSRMGALGVATTAIMSVLMFTYIAFAAAVAAASGFDGLLLKIGYIVLFALGSWFLVRPLLQRVLPGTLQGGKLSSTGVAVSLIGMVLYGLIGDRIGIHAMVGGFTAGFILPDLRPLREVLSAKVRDLAMIFFLPVFFAFSGFATDLKLITAETLPVVGLVLAAAIGSKFLAAVPGRFFGMSWAETGTLGALFNTRGLLVLVAGLIGLQLEIITTLTFTLIVVVALVTNLMTLPLLNVFSRRPPPTSVVLPAGGEVRVK